MLPQVEYFGPVARKVEGPEYALSGATMAERT